MCIAMQRLAKLYVYLVARQQLGKDIPMAMKAVGGHIFCVVLNAISK
jgi:hypothetical protein